MVGCPPPGTAGLPRLFTRRLLYYQVNFVLYLSCVHFFCKHSAPQYFFSTVCYVLNLIEELAKNSSFFSPPFFFGD